GDIGSREPRTDLDLGGEGPVYRTLVGALGELRALRSVQLPGQYDLALDLVELAFFRLAVGAVLRVDAGVRQAHGDAVERPALASRIQRERHRRSGAERDQEIVVRRRPCVGAAVDDRLVRDEAMLADENFLGESGG